MTDRQRIWLNEYLQCWNATEAARQAGYKWPEKMGPRNLQKFRAEIDWRLREKAMTSDEVLFLLGEQARSNMAEFVTETGAIDWQAVKTKGHLVKRISHNKGRNSSIELHDAQTALALLAKHLDLTPEHYEHSGPGGGPVQTEDVTCLSNEERARRIRALLNLVEPDSMNE